MTIIATAIMWALWVYALRIWFLVNFRGQANWRSVTKIFVAVVIMIAVLTFYIHMAKN